MSARRRDGICCLLRGIAACGARVGPARSAAPPRFSRCFPRTSQVASASVAASALATTRGFFGGARGRGRPTLGRERFRSARKGLVVASAARCARLRLFGLRSRALSASLRSGRRAQSTSPGCVCRGAPTETASREALTRLARQPDPQGRRDAPHTYKIAKLDASERCPTTLDGVPGIGLDLSDPSATSPPVCSPMQPEAPIIARVAVLMPVYLARWSLHH